MENNFTVGSTHNKLKANKLCLYDADFIKYVIASRVGKRLKEFWDAGQGVDSLSPFISQEITAWMNSEIHSKIEDPIIFCFSGKSFNTFRYHVAVEREYKGNRKITEAYPGELEVKSAVLKYFKENAITVLFSDLEADDIVCALQDENTYIASQDKDIKQKPGWHYDFKSNSIYEIDVKIAIYNLCKQLIMGDSTDYTVGIKGVGEKGATEFLSKLRPAEFIPETMKLYQTKLGQIHGTDAFVESWNLMKMRENRGTWFRSKYKSMFDIKEFIINKIKIENK